MLNINLTETSFDVQEFRKRKPKDSDIGELISGDCVGVFNRNPVFIYKKCSPEVAEDLRNTCINLRYAKGSRTLGMVSRSVIFGGRPRNHVRATLGCCSYTRLSVDSPSLARSLIQGASYFSQILETHNPDVFTFQKQWIHDNILPEWVLPGGVFTSGIVNKNNPLDYHYDGGNLKGSWSAMVVFKNKSKGGHLSLPRFGVSLDMADSTLVLFSGSTVLHGVTPISTEEDGYRYSIVWYPLQGMSKCLTLKQEIKSYAATRDNIETKPKVKPSPPPKRQPKAKQSKSKTNKQRLS